MMILTHLIDGFFFLQTGGNRGNGSTSNTFSYSDANGNTYSRKVDASLNTITIDEQSGTLAPAPSAQRQPQSPASDDDRGLPRLPSGRKVPSS